MVCRSSGESKSVRQAGPEKAVTSLGFDGQSSKQADELWMHVGV